MGTGTLGGGWYGKWGGGRIGVVWEGEEDGMVKREGEEEGMVQIEMEKK